MSKKSRFYGVLFTLAPDVERRAISGREKIPNLPPPVGVRIPSNL